MEIVLLLDHLDVIYFIYTSVSIFFTCADSMATLSSKPPDCAEFYKSFGPLCRPNLSNASVKEQPAALFG